MSTIPTIITAVIIEGSGSRQNGGEDRLSRKPSSLRLFEIGSLPFARLGLSVACAIAVPKLRDPSQGAAPARPVLPIRSSYD